jgi:hypothetical protein
MQDKQGETDLLRQLVRHSAICASAAASDHQLRLVRFWEETLATPRYAHPKRLLRHGFKVYSQCDEDGIIQEIFQRIGLHSRRFVEFGVGTGAECNTAKLLIEGWQGLWIEAVEQFAAQIRTAFAPYIGAQKLSLTQSFVTAENIDALLLRSGMQGEIDLLSIDIDCNDYWIWRAIAAIKPRVVVIEYNATLRPPLSLVVPYEPNRRWDGTSYFGASLEALVRLGREKGYRLVGCSFSGANAFFVQDGVAAGHFLDPPSAEEHYEPPRYFFADLAAGHRPRPGPFASV